MTDSDGAQRPIDISAGYVIYQLVASAIGALALIAFLNHFWHADWHGPLADIVRPAVVEVRALGDLLFDNIAQATGQAIGRFWRDYYLVGFTTFFGFIRSTLLTNNMSAAGGRLGLAVTVLDFLGNLVIWPVTILKAILQVFRRQPSQGWKISLLMMMPLIYVVLLLGVYTLLQAQAG